MKNEIIEFSKQSIDNIKEIDDLIDNALSDYKDIFETAGDLIKPIKAFISLRRAAQKSQFKSFLRAYAEDLRNEYSSGAQLEKAGRMEAYLSKKGNLNFIIDCIDSAINAKSINCSKALGFLTSLILRKEIDIDFKELIVLNALRNLNDIELKSAISISHKFDKTKEVQSVIDDNIDVYTVQKLKQLQVLEESRGGETILFNNSWGEFQISEVTEFFYQVLYDAKIELT